jgi:RimJ/RimL family protein N-acetyltransferase
MSGASESYPTRPIVPLSLTTARLVVRHFRAGDAPTLMAYRNDPEVARYQGWEGLSEVQAKDFVTGQSCQPVGVPHAWLQLALELRASGTHIGDLALKVDGAGQAEIGYSLSRAFQGQGYMREAVAALLDFLFQELQLHRVVAQTDVRNVPSVRLLERLGFRREGHFIEGFYLRGKWTSEYLYALLAREWRAAGSQGDGL